MKINNNDFEISVIIPMYNCELYLDNLLDNFLNTQTFKDIEIIVVNDGSTDNGEKIVLDYLNKYKNISYYRQENKGAGAARNYGLSKACGKYVICVDADDKYDSNLLECLHDAAKENDADLAICRFNLENHIDNSRRTSLGINDVPVNKPFKVEDYPNGLYSIHCGPLTKLYKKEFIDKYDLKYDTSRVANDITFFWKSLIKAEKVVCVDKVLVQVQRGINPDSITSNRNKYIDQSIANYINFSNWLRDNKISNQKTLKSIAKSELNGIFYNSTYGYNENFVRTIPELFKHEPWSILEKREYKDILSQHSNYKKHFAKLKNYYLNAIKKDDKLSRINIDSCVYHYLNAELIADTINRQYKISKYYLGYENRKFGKIKKAKQLFKRGIVCLKSRSLKYTLYKTLYRMKLIKWKDEYNDL